MASFIIAAGVILSILSGITFCPFYHIDERTLDDAVTEVCNTDSYKNFIQCEVIPGNSQDGPFNPRAIYSLIGQWSGIIFATVKPSPLVVNPEDVRIIRKVIGPFMERRIPVHKEINVAISFHDLQHQGLRMKEEQSLKALSMFGLAPVLYVLGNKDGPILTNYMFTERIEGLALSFYITMTEDLEESERQDMEARLSLTGLLVSEKFFDRRSRLPGLRLLYIHLETMLLLERLHIRHKWRHCNLDLNNVVVRKTTDEGIRQLEEQLRKDEEENGHMEKDDLDAWIDLQMEARTMEIQEDKDTVHSYQTDNSHMIFAHTEMAERVVWGWESDRMYQVCRGPSDISRISTYWQERTEVEGNDAHLTPMTRALMEIFAPLAKLEYLTAYQEERKLKEVIGKLKVLEEKEKLDFIARLKVFREKMTWMQKAPVLQRQQEAPPLIVPKTFPGSGRVRIHSATWTPRQLESHR